MEAAVRPTVLFVDDEPRILTALQVVFRKDYEVVTAPGGAAAIELLRNRDVDVVVSDQRMPGVTGVEVLRAARELRPRAARLLLTGYSDMSAIVGSINEGEVFRFVKKPWVNGELRATLVAALKASGDERAAVAPGLDSSGGRAAAPATVQAAEGGRGVGVLVLDDDAQVHEHIRRMLGNTHAVWGASSLEAGATLLQQHAIGIIITDIVVGGRHSTALLGTSASASRVAIVLTAQTDAEHYIDLINRGQIYRLLHKPINDQLLRGTVNLASRRFETLALHPEPVPVPFAAAVPVAPVRAATAVEENTGLLARFVRRVMGWMRT